MKLSDIVNHLQFNACKEAFKDLDEFFGEETTEERARAILEHNLEMGRYEK